jgi:phenylpropionate dioxygenase-like ring-hydroxylating dioxygenase large terminal subunit
MLFHRNAWYVAARPEDLSRALQRRIIMNEPILLYRTEAGEAVAMQDRCPHRFAPLSRGTLFGDVVQCKYHGLRFDRSGHCVLNPHGGGISQRIRIRSYPVAERHGFVWIWMGDATLAQADQIPDLSHMFAAGVRTVFGYSKTDYRYDILVDNLLDLSHTDYLHVGTFMGGESDQRSETRAHEVGDEVITVLTQRNAPVPPGYEKVAGVWRFGRQGSHSAEERVDLAFTIHWRPGQVISFEKSVAPVGGDLATPPKVKFTHIATPETQTTTHYFMSFTRDFAIEDPQVDAKIAAFQLGTVQNEDSPMLKAVADEMTGRELLEMRPVMIPNDAGALRVRRVMKRLIERESSAAAAEMTDPPGSQEQ